MSTASAARISSVGVLAKTKLREAATHLVEIDEWLASRQVRAVFETETAGLMPPSPGRAVAAKSALAAEVGMVVVLGGDGTLLGMAKSIAEAGSKIPILGVNFGSLGFLTEVTLPELYPSLDAALSGQAHVEERMMLRSAVIRGGKTFSEHVVVNDAVITKAALARMIDLSVWVGDELVTRVRADGLIVATPTGSTAYNLAVGGPIVQPSVDALLLTPIAPHTLTNRPVVVPGAAVVRVRPAIEARDDVFVTFDGQAGFQLEPGDEVTARRADEPLRLIRSTTRGYFEVLRTKLKWGGR
jgi:NAD+ kinase